MSTRGWGTAAITAAYVALMLAPLLAGIAYSLLYSLGLAGLLGKGFTLAHWQHLLADASTWHSILLTCALTLVTLLLSLALALLLAFALRFIRKAPWLEAVLQVPLNLPPVVMAFAVYHLLAPSGLLARLLQGAGSDPQDFPRLVNDGWAVGMVVAQVLIVFPFLALHFLNLVDKEGLTALRQVSATLGAGEAQFFRKVYLPLLLRRSAPVLLMYGIFLMGTYEVPLLLGRSKPRALTLLIVERVSRFDLAAIPEGHALAVLYALLTGAVVTAYIYFKIRQMRQS